MTETGSEDRTELDEQLAEATRLAESGDADAAFELLLALEDRHPEDPMLLCMLGLIAEEAQVSGMSYDYFRRCLAAQPHDPAVLAALGTGLARYDDPDAEGVLRLGALTAPDSAEARLRYGAYLSREGQSEQALAELQAAYTIDPGSAEVLRELGVAFLLAARDEEAAGHLEAAVAADPSDPEGPLLHGLALWRSGDAAGAAEALFRVAQAVPEDAELQVAAALACAAQGWDDEAWNAVARAEGSPDPVDGDVLADVEEAIEAGPEAANEMMTQQIAPRLLHDRLLQRS